MSTENTKTDDLAVDPGKAEPIGVQRLRLARERAAALRASEPVDENPPKRVQVGDIVHAVATGLQIPRTASLWGGDPALNLRRGDTFVVTQQMLDADLDRNGKPGWSVLVHDEHGQYQRWGRLHIAPGEAPEGMQPWVLGDPDWREAREAARQRAWRIIDEQEQREAFAEIHRVYGPGRD